MVSTKDLDKLWNKLKSKQSNPQAHNQAMKKSDEKKKLVRELRSYFKRMDTQRLYTHPDQKDTKDWLAEVSAILKNLDESDYLAFQNHRQHLYSVIPRNTRKHAAQQLEVFIRDKIAAYKRYDFSHLDAPVGDNEENTPIGENKDIRIFLSYSSLNKVGVGKIKTWLSNLGFNVFLAHEDIEPSLEWQRVIIQNLESCHIFIPVITKEFTQSKWTDQESGIAFIKKKMIIPLSVDGNNPHGFIGIYQGLPMSREDIEKPCIKIVKTIIKNKKYAPIVIDLLINSLGKSRTFASAEWKTSIISEYDSFTKEQFDSLLRNSAENNQVYIAAGSRVDLSNLIKKYPNLVSRESLEMLNSKDPDFKFG